MPNQSQFEEIQLPLNLMLSSELLCKSIQMDADGNEFAEFDGIVSTEHADVAGDVIVQKGVDWNHFAQHGMFDWEHSKEPEDIIGVPTEVRQNVICKGQLGTYVKGKLLLKQPRAREVYNLMKSLQGSGRQMGFSVLGKGMRDPLAKHRIVKSLFSRVAFTVTPVNTYAGGGLVSVVKSLDGMVDAPEMQVQVSFDEFHEMVRKSLGGIVGFDSAVFAATLFEQVALDEKLAHP